MQFPTREIRNNSQVQGVRPICEAAGCPFRGANARFPIEFHRAIINEIRTARSNDTSAGNETETLFLRDGIKKSMYRVL